MSLLGRVDAIKAALGLPESIVGALPIVAAANLAMGIEPDACATLPAMVEKLEGVLGLQPLPATVPRAGAAPAQRLHSPATSLCTGPERFAVF